MIERSECGRHTHSLYRSKGATDLARHGRSMRVHADSPPCGLRTAFYCMRHAFLSPQIPRRTRYSLLAILAPALSFAQASPFQTGATALETNLLAILTPVAVILVIGLGIMAMANRIAWGWCIGAIAGIAISFGAPQIVGWIRSMFGV